MRMALTLGRYLIAIMTVVAPRSTRDNVRKGYRARRDGRALTILASSRITHIPWRIEPLGADNIIHPRS